MKVIDIARPRVNNVNSMMIGKKHWNPGVEGEIKVFYAVI